jgi:hypothetical protein
LPRSPSIVVSSLSPPVNNGPVNNNWACIIRECLLQVSVPAFCPSQSTRPKAPATTFTALRARAFTISQFPALFIFCYQYFSPSPSSRSLLFLPFLGFIAQRIYYRPGVFHFLQHFNTLGRGRFSGHSYNRYINHQTSKYWSSAAYSSILRLSLVLPVSWSPPGRTPHMQCDHSFLCLGLLCPYLPLYASHRDCATDDVMRDITMIQES